MDTDAMLWKINSFIGTLSADEIDLFNADLEDAVSGVIEDWEGTKWVASQQLT
jgi:hypothetical protein